MANTAKFYYREDTSLIETTVTTGVGAALLSSEQSVVIDGGGFESATEHVFPGNSEASLAIGGITTPADVTVEILYTDFTAPKVVSLMNASGQATVQAVVTPKNPETKELEYGNSLGWTGVLKGVTPPKRDAAASGKGMIKIVFTPNGQITS